ncbi:MAG: Ryanodine receptor Ryr [Muribaculaceae bacterium]|nr:Ryanodine receptor Ryr [Muribaculaceae bacterium]
MVTACETLDNYNPLPINVEDIELDEDLEELTEAIAENAHDTWARARMDEGWRFGPVRDDKKKEHPDLVPYSHLPESEKEYDRIMAMNTLRLVRRLGFNITKCNPHA